MKGFIKKCVPVVLKHKIVKYLAKKHYALYDDEISYLARQELQYSWDLSNLRNEFEQFLYKLPYKNFEPSMPPHVIWWCWLQGEEFAPDICKACLASIKKNLPNFEIRIVTEDNMFTYIHPPKFIIDKYKQGIISRTHFSDILRTLLLVEHGGIWIDSTVLCTGYTSHIFDYPLFVFQNWKFNINQCMVASSWLISSQKEHPILKDTCDLLFEYWKKHDILANYFLFHFFFQMATEKYSEIWETVPRYSNIPPHILQFELFKPFNQKRFEQIKRMSDFHKLTWKHNIENINLNKTYFEMLCQQIIKS